MSDGIKLYANLHLHSTHSDGVYSPEELVRIACDEGYRAIACTDHDTYTANPEMMRAAEKYGLECIYGIEFNTLYPEEKKSFHMTAFGFDGDEPMMKEYLRELSERETYQTRMLVERGLSLGLIEGITWDEIVEYNKGITWLCNDHVFRAMKAKGLIDDLGYPDFFENVFGNHRFEIEQICPYKHIGEVIKLVHNAGGVACIAHPHGQLELVPELVGLGLDGIEVWHSMLTSEERRRALELALKYDLYVSGGSDHEGMCGGQYPFYEHPEETEFWIPELSTGTTEYFFREIRDKRKMPDRASELEKLIADESAWVRRK